MEKDRHFALVFLMVLAFALLVAAWASADLLEFSCTPDPAATGYRIKSAPGLPPVSWAVLAEATTCAFSVQRPAVKTFYQLCAFNQIGEECRADNGFWSLPASGLTVRDTKLQ